MSTEPREWTKQDEIDIKRSCMEIWEAGRRAGIREGRKEVVGFANKFLLLAEKGDYSNGNEAFGVDEGRVRAGELLDNYRKEWQAQLMSWGIEEER